LGLSLPVSEDDEDQTMGNVTRKVGEENAVLAVVFSLDEVRSALKEALTMGEYHLIGVSQYSWSAPEYCADTIPGRVKNYGLSFEPSKWIF
jgi:hypothetical protein